MKYDYDIIVIGSGSAGISAVEYATSHGAKTAIVEKHKLGGECPNYACVPAKVFLKSAELYRNISRMPDFGIECGKPSFDWKKIKNRRDQISKALTDPRVKNILEQMGADIIMGEAIFIDEHTIAVKGEKITAKSFVIATGSSSFIPPIQGIDQIPYITSVEVNELEELPKSIAIVGCGAVGAEYATVFRSFDVDVHIFEGGQLPLRVADEDASKLVLESFVKMGIHMHLNSTVDSFDQVGGRVNIHYSVDDEKHDVQTELVLIATGQRPNTRTLNLDRIGVDIHEKRGYVMVDDYLQSTQKNIYTAGDVSTKMMFTHTAAYEGRIAAHNALAKRKTQRMKVEESVIPWAIYSYPEVSAVGLTEVQAIDEFGEDKVVSGLYQTKWLGRGFIDAVPYGMVKVIAHKKKGTILGGHAVGPCAGEMIHEIAVCMRNNMTLEAISKTIHAFPTFSEAVKAAAVKAMNKM